jgi:hypothetical protein
MNRCPYNRVRLYFHDITRPRTKQWHGQTIRGRPTQDQVLTAKNCISMQNEISKFHFVAQQQTIVQGNKRRMRRRSSYKCLNTRFYCRTEQAMSNKGIFFFFVGLWCNHMGKSNWRQDKNVYLCVIIVFIYNFPAWHTSNFFMSVSFPYLEI